MVSGCALAVSFGYVQYSRVVNMVHKVSVRVKHDVGVKKVLSSLASKQMTVSEFTTCEGRQFQYSKIRFVKKYFLMSMSMSNVLGVM